MQSRAAPTWPCPRRCRAAAPLPWSQSSAARPDTAAARCHCCPERCWQSDTDTPSHAVPQLFLFFFFSFPFWAAQKPINSAKVLNFPFCTDRRFPPPEHHLSWQPHTAHCRADIPALPAQPGSPRQGCTATAPHRIPAASWPRCHLPGPQTHSPAGGKQPRWKLSSYQPISLDQHRA